MQNSSIDLLKQSLNFFKMNYNDGQNEVNGLGAGAQRTKHIAQILSSVNKNLSDGWYNISDSINQLDIKSKEFVNNFVTVIEAYIEEVERAENPEIQAVEEVNKKTQEINSEIDALFG